MTTKIEQKYVKEWANEWIDTHLTSCKSDVPSNTLDIVISLMNSFEAKDISVSDFDEILNRLEEKTKRFRETCSCKRNE